MFMKKIYFIAICVAFLVSCGNNSGQKSQSPDVDSCAQEEEIEDPEYTAWKADSVLKANKKTYDMTFCEVHGPVHCIYDQNNRSYVFDKDGNIILYCGYNPFKRYSYDFYWQTGGVQFKRDDKGRINDIEGHESDCKYIWDGDVIIREEWCSEAFSGTNEFSYDEKELRTKIISTESEFEEDTTTEEADYTYIEFDQYGNWTERKHGNNHTETRSILYYPLNYSQTESTGFNPETDTYCFVGKIGTDEGLLHGDLLVIGPDGGYYIVSNGRRSARFKSYDESDGTLIIDAYANNTDKYIGSFNGKYDSTTNKYTGIFTNTKGGQVSFTLTQE